MITQFKRHTHFSVLMLQEILCMHTDMTGY